jgi:hypothetical protein
MGGKKLLNLPERLEPLQPPLALAGWLMRVLYREHAEPWEAVV